MLMGLWGGNAGLERIIGAAGAAGVVRMTAPEFPGLPPYDPPPMAPPEAYPPELLRLCASAVPARAVTASAANSAPDANFIFMLFSSMCCTDSGPEIVRVQGRFTAPADENFEIAGVEKGKDHT
jgi:hypothetical protein